MDQCEVVFAVVIYFNRICCGVGGIGGVVVVVVVVGG